MDRIHHDKIKMHSKAYFVIGSVLTFLGLASSMVVSIFLVGLIQFSLRTHGPMGEYRLNQIISSFPWWLAVIAILGLALGVWLLRRYDFSYKINFKAVVIIFVMAIIAAGWIIDMTRLSDILIRQRPGREIMKRYFQENNIQPGQERGEGKNNLYK